MIPPPPPALRDVPEAELIRSFRAGGKPGDQAYSELVRRYQAHIVRLVGYLLGDSADAEDVAQEAFVKAFLARDSFDRGENFAGWIRTIATRVAFNCRRDAATRQKYHALTSRPEPKEHASEAELRDLLLQVLKELSYPYREILVLRYVEELSVAEIGGILALGESATKMRLMRAREEFWAIERERGA